MESCFDNIQNVKKLKFEKERAELRLCSDSPGQNIWNKIEKSSKNGQKKNSLIFPFAFFLLLLPKFNFWNQRLGTRVCLHPNLRFSKYFLISLDLKVIWKSSFCSLHLQWWFKFLERMLIWFKKVSSVKKAPIRNSESFQKSIFDLN